MVSLTSLKKEQLLCLSMLPEDGWYLGPFSLTYYRLNEVISSSWLLTIVSENKCAFTSWVLTLSCFVMKRIRYVTFSDEFSHFGVFCTAHFSDEMHAFMYQLIFTWVSVLYVAWIFLCGTYTKCVPRTSTSMYIVLHAYRECGVRLPATTKSLHYVLL